MDLGMINKSRIWNRTRYHFFHFSQRELQNEISAPLPHWVITSNSSTAIDSYKVREVRCRVRFITKLRQYFATLWEAEWLCHDILWIQTKYRWLLAIICHHMAHHQTDHTLSSSPCQFWIDRSLVAGTSPPTLGSGLNLPADPPTVQKFTNQIKKWIAFVLRSTFRSDDSEAVERSMMSQLSDWSWHQHWTYSFIFAMTIGLESCKNCLKFFQIF